MGKNRYLLDAAIILLLQWLPKISNILSSTAHRYFKHMEMQATLTANK